MFLNLLLRRGRSDSDPFRVRGEGVSRVEGFSDTVFGFAITLLVISTGVPKTSTELLDMRHSVLPFIASFSLLFAIWRAQFEFFRRFGLEDRRTVTLTGLLLLVVLLAVYPLKFLFTFMLDVLPVALLAGDDSMRQMMPLGHFPAVLLLYAIGLCGVMGVLSLLYRHAASRSAELGLSGLELFDTWVLERRFRAAAIVGAAIIVWCLAQLSVIDHLRRRDDLWSAVYWMGIAAVVATAGVQRRAVRRLRAQRPIPPSDVAPRDSTLVGAA
jgi:uncharacterized membrane protein